MRPQIRPATTDDATGIATAHVRSWQRAYRGVLPDTFLNGMDVEPRGRVAYRPRRGLGSGLGWRRRGALGGLTADGFGEAMLWVLRGNDRAIRFYRAAGSDADGTEKQDEIAGTPISEIRFRRALPGA